MTESQLVVSSSPQNSRRIKLFLARHKKTIVISLGIFIISMIYNLTINRIFILDIDETHLIKRTMAALSGELPLIDFTTFTYPPGHYWFFGFFFKLFGPSIILERLLWTILRSLVPVLTFLLSKYLVSKPFVFLPVALTLFMPSIYYKTMVPFLTVLSLYPLFLTIAKKRNKWLILSGAVSGLTLWFRQDIGIFLLCTACACIFLQHVSIKKTNVFPQPLHSTNSPKNILKKLGLFCSAFLLAFVPLVVIYGIQGKAATFLWNMFLRGPLGYISNQKTLPRKFPNFRELFQLPLDWDSIFLWIPVFIFVCVFLLLFFRFARQKLFTDHNLYLLATLFMSILTFNLTVQNANFERILEDSVPTYILVAYILGQIYTKLKSSVENRIHGWTKISSIKLAAFILLLSGPVFFTVYGLTQKNVNDRFIYKRRPNDIVYSDTGVWLVKGQLRRKVRFVNHALWKVSHRDDRIVFITAALLFYHSNKKGLVEYDVQIEFLNETNLSRYFAEFDPKFIAVENWALAYFKRFSESFQQDFEMNYAPQIEGAGLTIFIKNQDT